MRRKGRLSPNEEAQLAREELQRRRKLRLQQVREQERCIALQVRREVQERRERQLQSLGAALRDEWQNRKGERIRALEKLYGEHLRDVGRGHRNAKENEPDRAALALKKEQNEQRAAERHQRALRGLVTQRRAEAEQRNRLAEARKKVLMVEKERAANIASLPHAPDPVESVTIKTPLQPKMSVMQHYAVTHYHVPETAVEREGETDAAQPDAQEAAEFEARRLEQLEKEDLRDRQERLERARLRGDHALRREKGNQDNARLLGELERLQQAELQRRRHTAHSVPARIFQPLYRHHDLRAEQQRELEDAFQDLCTGDREIRDDVVLQSVSEPLPPPVPSSKIDSTRESDLDVTLEPDEPPCEEEEEDAAQEAAPPQSSSAPAEGTGRMALRRMLNRIRTQRDQWSRREAVDDGGDVHAGQTHGDEHGLASELEWQQASSLDEGTAETSAAEKDSELSEDSIVDEDAGQADEPSVDADLGLSAGINSKLVCLDNYQQMGPPSCSTQEEELNRQQVEQFSLLQELEEKRRSLELQLEEAKRHRLQEALQGTRSVQESPSPPLQEMLPEPSAGVLMSSVSDSTHTQRLHQYQQRLLTQNRLHQKTIDDARRNLEEYKQTLKIRYAPVAMPTAETPPPPEAVVSFPSLPDDTHSTADTHPGNANTPPETWALDMQQSRADATPADPACLVRPPRPSLGPVSDSVAASAQPPTRSSSDVPLLPPAVFLEYLRNRRARAPLEHAAPAGAPQQDGGETETQQQIRERMHKQGGVLQALIKAQRAPEATLSLHDAADADAAVTQRRSDPLLVSTPSRSRAHKQPSAVSASGEPSSDGRVNPPVSWAPRTLQNLLHDFEQHKLSTIEEVDTPVNVTTDAAADLLTESSSADGSDYSLTPPTPGSGSSRGHISSSEVMGSEVSSSGPRKLTWREMLRLESAATHSLQEEEPEPVVPHDGASSVREFLSSTTLSTGSYFSSEREPSFNVADNSLFTGDFPARPGASLTSPSNSLQHIIDKYTKQLDTSLRAIHTGVINADADVLTAPTQSPTLPLHCNPLDSNSLSSATQDTFQFLSPEITDADTTALSDPPGENSTANTAASDWPHLQHLAATDQPSFASAGFPQWEWTLGNNSELQTPDTSVSYDGRRQMGEMQLIKSDCEP